jgi:beta/gamma crystallin
MKRTWFRRITRVGFSVLLFVTCVPQLTAQDYRYGGGSGDGGITVYRDENFRGRSATFQSDVPNLRRYDLNDRITSLRIAPGESWEACEDTDYRGPCQIFSRDERDLRRLGWTDRISSLRRVRGGPGRFPVPPITKGGIVLYDEPGFRGNTISIGDPVEDLRDRNFNDRAESVRVVSGTWEVCVDQDFRNCQTLDRDFADLSSLGLRKRISSIRPVGSGWGREDRSGRPGGRRYRGSRSARLLLFEGADYRGPSVTLDSESADLSGFGGRARSLQVVSGTWLVCDRPNFSGRCQEVSESVPDVQRWGFGGSIRSARPVDGY